MAKDMMKLQLAYKGSEYSRTVVVQKRFSLAFLREPSAAEIHARVWHLHELVRKALPVE